MNENQPTQAPAPAPAPMPAMPATPALTPLPVELPVPPTSHAMLWVAIGAIVVIALGVCGYVYLMKGGYPADRVVTEEVNTVDPQVAALEAALAAEPLGELGVELQSINQEIAP